MTLLQWYCDAIATLNRHNEPPRVCHIIHGTVIADHRDALVDYMWPQPDSVGGDLRNAYNEILRRLALVPRLRLLVATFWAILWPCFLVVLVEEVLPAADVDSAEGTHQQGDGLANSGFCVGIHPEIGVGSARFSMDDVYDVRLAHVVLPVVTQFAQVVFELWLDLKVTKRPYCCSPGVLEACRWRSAYAPMAK